MKRNKWSHLNDYKPDDTGGYSYEGVYLTMEGDRRRIMVPLFILSGAAIVLSASAGLIPGSFISESAPAIAGYTISVILSFVCMYKLIYLALEGENVRLHVHKRTASQLPYLTLAGAIALAESIASSVVLWIIHPGDADALWETATILLCAAAAGVYVVMYLRIKRIKWI